MTTTAPGTVQRLPNALADFSQLKLEFIGKELFLFLDFDGTLAPIVPKPENASLSERGKKVLATLANQLSVAILSGRDRADVAKKIGLHQLVYAGSHGFDISGPNNLALQYTGGVEALPDLEKAHKILEDKLKRVEGAWAERKKYAIAVHYRHTPDALVPQVKQEIEALLADCPKLKLVGGKKIYELKPDLDWHKGRALEWLLNKLKSSNNVLPIFIGDDVTDEDALQAIHKSGVGILVGKHGKPTWARYTLANTIEVEEFLERLAKTL